jgi:hypothetical protein
MDFVCFLTEHLAKAIDFDIYAPSKSGGMTDMHACSTIKANCPKLNYSPADKACT